MTFAKNTINLTASNDKIISSDFLGIYILTIYKKFKA